jgi:uncharacterized membrane protein affecting hemolysin expression
MKKIIGVILLLGVLSVSDLSNVQGSPTSITSESDAIRCSIYDSEGELIARCHFCNCDDFRTIICGCEQMS